MSTELQASYGWCRDIAQRSGSSFYRSFSLLTPVRRQSMEAFYAFARLTDDLSDSPQAIAASIDENAITSQKQILAAWKDKVEKLLDRDSRQLRFPSPAENATHDGHESLAMFEPLWPALHDTILRHQIPLRYFTELIDGVVTDLEPSNIQTYQDLHNYCYHVASTVGLVCLHIWDADVNSILWEATECGVAFQLTNILRDIGSDAAIGRIYIPREEILDAGLSVDNWLAGTPDSQWREVFRANIQRARDAYQASWPIVKHLEGDGQRMFSLMFRSYLEILERIGANPNSVWSKPAKPSKMKLAMLFLLHTNPLLYRILREPKIS